MKFVSRYTAFLLVLTLTFTVIVPTMASAVSSTSKLIYFYINEKKAYINGQEVILDTPATAIKNTIYVPIKFLGDTLGFQVTYNQAKKITEIVTPTTLIQLDFVNKVAYENGMPVPLESVAALVNNRTMVRVKQMARYMNIKEPNYNNELKRIELMFVPTAENMYDPDKNNSKPIAKFTFAKTSYRKGEPVKFLDLSYDPDGEGIVNYEWTAKKDAYFEAGSFPVTLKVTDRSGNISTVYTRNITIVDTTYLTAEQYALQMQAPGTFLMKAEFTDLFNRLRVAPFATKTTEYDTRKLLFSDSPETYTQTGILYEDRINGMARIYAHHINGMKVTTQLSIYLTNRTDHAVNVKTTNKGEAYPSLNPALVGHVASTDLLLHDPVNENFAIAPGETIVYHQLPLFYPNMGANLIYDLETDDELTVTVAALDPGISGAEGINTGIYAKLDKGVHVRGTFPYSDTQWTIDGSLMSEPTRVTIGDGTTDTFAKGIDAMTGVETINKGSFGIVYHIRINNPKKMAILFLARAGGYKGPMTINGEVVQVPKSGIITPLDRYTLVERTKGTEGVLDIEITPPAGSNLPVDLVFYPLDTLTP